MSSPRDLNEKQCLELTGGHCPECGSRGFVLGPQGGAAINIECAEVSCRARFNVVSVSGRILLGRRIERECDGGTTWPNAP